jgi:hypothetical protein
MSNAESTSKNQSSTSSRRPLAGVLALLAVVSTAGAIGVGIPFGIGARAATGGPVVALMGDGSFGFHMAEFDTAQDTRQTKRIATGREISERLLYWTAFVDGQGRVAFREDVYSRDAKLAEALGIALSLPTPVDDGRVDVNDVGP